MGITQCSLGMYEIKKELAINVYLLQKLEEQRIADIIVMIDEFDCPIFKLLPALFLVPSSIIINLVSFVHHCRACVCLKGDLQYISLRESWSSAKTQYNSLIFTTCPIFCFILIFILSETIIIYLN